MRRVLLCRSFSTKAPAGPLFLRRKMKATHENVSTTVTTAAPHKTASFLGPYSAFETNHCEAAHASSGPINGLRTETDDRLNHAPSE